MKKTILSVMALAIMAMPMYADVAAGDYMNPIITSMPSLSICPDARAGGMGDVGAATAPDLNSQHWNAAKYAFMESHGGITANYTPWLRKLVSDIDLAHIAGYYTISEMAGTVSASFTYFSLGTVQLTDLAGTFLQDARPNEWALDVAYSRKLHEYVSMAATMRFMYSDLNNGANSSTNGGAEMHPAWTMAADVAVYYAQPLPIKTGNSVLSVGFVLSNLGGKMSYDGGTTKSFIPANMRIGVGYRIPFDKYNSLSINVDLNKLLVPTRKSKYTEGFDKDNSDTWNMSQEDWSNLSSVKGWFRSFADAPKGISEEFRELQLGLGLEYSYDQKFFARVGYSQEDKMKGNRRYFTFGAGFHLSIFSLDVAYVCATAATNPLDQTLRFTLGFDLAGIKDLVKK